MRRRYVTVDVFTDRPYAGNPLAVVLDAKGLSTAQMQAIASEFNYAETTFVLAAQSTAHTAQVRIFTPRNEMPFAGHPNVGTAYVLARRAPGNAERVKFEELAGIVPVEILKEDGEVIGAELTAPEPLSQRSFVTAEAVAKCLSLEASDIAEQRHRPQIVSVGLPFLVAEIRSREALSRAKPNVAAFYEIFPRDGADAIYFYTRDGAGGGQGVDLQARMFAPLDGVPEDPATGSATAAVTAYLAALEPGSDAKLVLGFSQGVDMGRPSRLRARAAKRHGVVEETHVGGRCAEVMEGSFELTGQA